MSTDAEIRHAMIELVGAGSVPHDGLLTAMQALGDSAGRTANRILRMDSAFADFDDVCYLPALVDGTSWTFGVDADDADAGFVRMHPALSPLGWWLISSGAELVDDAGDPIGDVSTDGIWLDGRDTDVVIGPPGWLDAVAGGLATLTVRSEQLQVTRCDVPCEQRPVRSTPYAPGSREWRPANRSDRSATTPLDCRVSPATTPCSLRCCTTVTPSSRHRYPTSTIST